MTRSNDPVQVTARLSHPVVQAGIPAQLFLRVDVSAEPAEGERTPLDLAVVLDRSGSMAGSKMSYARQAFHHVVDRLQASDRLALVAYDSRVDIVVPAQAVGGDAVVMRARADTIEPRGTTNLSAGLIAGLQQVGSGGPGIHRVLLLSDGLANQGVTDVAGLSDIAGQALVGGRSISTFGVGHDYDENLLRTVADAGAGSYYYISSPEDIPRVFLEELGELGRVVAQNLQVDLIPAAAEIVGVLGFGGSGLPAQAGDVVGGATRTVLIALSLPPAEVGEVPLGVVRCRWTPLEGGFVPREVVIEVAAVATHDVSRVEAAVDQEVLRAAQLQLAADAHQAAVEAARRGDPEAFQTHLAAGTRALEALGKDADSLAPDQVALNKELHHRGFDAGRDDRDLHLRTHYSQYRSRKMAILSREARLAAKGIHRGSEPDRVLEPWGSRTPPLPPALRLGGGGGTSTPAATGEIGAAGAGGDSGSAADGVRGMLLGLAVGDALGNTSEGLLPEDRAIDHGEIRDYLPNRHAGGRPVGLPSDDTQLAFWTLESILREGSLDPHAVAEAFAGNGPIHGIGTTVRAFLRAFKDEGRPWYDAGQPSAGNGALMRIAPVLVPHLTRPTPALWVDVVRATVLTHRDEAAVAASVGFVGLLAECLVRPTGSAPPPRWWPETFLHYARPIETGEQYRPRRPGLVFSGTLCDFVETHVVPAVDDGLSVRACGDRWHSGAYLLETLPVVLATLARHGHDPEEALVRAVNDTRDNDTTAAIVGAAVGALHGAEALPVRWRQGLLGRTRDDDDGRVERLIDEAVRRFLGT